MEIGTKFIHKGNNIECELIEKPENGFASGYILKDNKGITFWIPKRILMRDFKKGE